MDQTPKTKYDSLPADIKEAILAANISEKIRQIGAENDLRIDQIGALAEEVDNVLIGDSDANDFVDKIEDILAIDTQKAINITASINLDIFTAIRDAVLSKEQPVPVKKEPTPEPEEVIGTKEDIMAEIENPTPAVHPITTAIADMTLPELTTSKPSEQPATPVQTAPVEPAALKKTYSVDPYREPLM